MPVFSWTRHKNALLRNLFGVLFFFSYSLMQAQVFFSTDPAYLKSKTEQNNLLSRYWKTYPDTTIDNLSSIFPRNFLGNVGLPSPNYLFRYGTDDSGFRLYQFPYANDRFNEKEVKYLKSPGPFVDLTATRGRFKFQAFKMLYTQTFQSRFTVTVKFSRHSSTGYYLKQLSSTQNFYVSNHYTTKNERFGYYLYYLDNQNKHSENGGISSVLLNDSTVLLKKTLLPVKLSGAERTNKERKAMFNPWLKVNKRADSIPGLDHFIQWKSAYAGRLYWYTDSAPWSDQFYGNIYLDTLKTNDSSRVKQFINELNYTVKSSSNRFGMSAGYKNELNLLSQQYDSTFINHIAQADLLYSNFIVDDTSAKAGFETKFNLQYVAGGANVGNYKAESNSIWWLNLRKGRNVYLDVLTENRNADHLYNNWIANNFYWFNNGFKKQQQTQVQAGVNFNRVFRASVFYQDVFNYLYFDENALPAQFHKNIQTAGVQIGFAKVFLGHLGVALDHTYQNASHDIVRVPQHVTGGKLYFVYNSRKNTLQFQLGARAQLYQSFKAYAYMPATQTFYLQDVYNTSSSPFLDLYMHARLRPAAVFFSMENVLQGSGRLDYSFVPGYYQHERMFRFGISWMFFD